METTTTNKLIILSYKLYTTEDGEKELVEETTSQHPFKFISGMGTMIEAFENQVVNLKQGDKFDFTILCKDAYGEYDDDKVIELPRTTFEVDGRFDEKHVYKDAVIMLADSEGHRVNSSVTDVTDTSVVVDLNNPLAGADLTFVGEIIESRPATNDEIQDMVKSLDSEDGCCCGEDDCCKGECNHEHHGDNCCGEHGHCHKD